MKNFAKALVLTLIFCATGVYAQTNLLINGGFEQNLAPQYGDNLDWNIAPWVPEFDDRSNVVQVDGPGGNTSYGNFGPASDATGGAEQQHYYNQIGPHSVYQQFTPVCSGEVNYGAYFSTREGKEGRGEILILDPSSSNQIGLPAVVNLPPGGDSENDPWVLAASSATLTANTDYVFYVVFDGNPNMDNAYVAFETDCVVDDIDPSDVKLTKTCEPPVPHQHNNALGQRWECKIDVDVPIAPFTGSITLQDVFTNTPLVGSQILLGQSLSGNASCFAGDCRIEGANFDPSRTESFQFDIFVEALEGANVYPLQNCVNGTLTSASDVEAALMQSCATAQWIPRADVSKTCEAIPEDAAAPFTLNCQIDVTANNLVGGTYIDVVDFFGALPPAVHTVTPPFMNVTSTEPWICSDFQSNAGVCELSALDMLNAGGTSTLNTSIIFDVDQTPAQVANCRDVFISDVSVVDQLNKKSSALANPLDGRKSSALPDGCVVVDVPAPAGNPVKLESVDFEKMCKDPVQGMHNGASGYFWDCEILAAVQPTPFNGTLTVVEDASNISAGQAEFVSASIPCNGIATDTLTCEIDGNTMSQPHPISVQLFTEIVSGEEPVKWENCVSGTAQTTAVTLGSRKSCTETTIKPDFDKLPDPEKLVIKKSCEAEPVLTTRDGVEGIEWNCVITAFAQPAPFNGVFNFTEDASNIAGTSNGEIVSLTGQNPAWDCQQNLPSSQTSCGIPGPDFSLTGEENLEVTLFAPIGKEPIKWENCVSGVYSGSSDKIRIGGDCEAVSWEPQRTEPPKLSLKKSCQGPTSFDDAQRYLCNIAVTNTGGPVTNDMTLAELFQNTSGAPATDYLLQLLGSPGWACASAPFTNGASCDITATDFNANNGHQISGIFLIPDAVLAEQDFKNCAALNMGDSVVANAPCFAIPEPDPMKDPALDVSKTCKASGERMVLSDNAWFQPMECTIVVTSNGVPFNGPIWLSDDMLYGPNNGSQSVISITPNNDPWQCTLSPFAPGGNQPACVIPANQFPYAAGQSELTVSMVLYGAQAVQFGAENCVSLSVGEQPDFDNAIASDCHEFMAPPAPSLEVVKTCEPAVRTGNQWTAQCAVTVTGSNLQPGLQLRVTDELSGGGTTTVTAGAFNPGPLTGNNCGGWSGQSTQMAACDLTTDMLIANGGTVTLPYTATLFSTTLMNGQPARNCAYADIPQTGQHAPGGPGGKTCVSIPLSSVIDDPVGPFDPGILTGPVLNPDVFVPTPFKPSLSVAKFQTEACVANRNTQRYTCGFRLGVTNSGPGAFSGPMVLTDTFTSPGGQAVTVLSGGGWSCANPVNGAISCENASLTLAPGATSNIDLSMQVQGLVRGGSFQNCAALGIPDDRRQRVAAIQQVMNARGLNAGPVDGQPGRRTYAALAELQRSLGLPVSQSFDDGLFRALGLVLQEPGKQSCITVDLPRMPPAPLQCDAATTVPRGESCACRYDNMIQRNTASCQCKAGYVFTADRGCTPAPKPDPTPTPRPTPDTPRPAPDTPSQPRCENGLPRVNGKCLSIQIMPGGGGDGPAGADGCRIMVGGVCIK